MNRHFIPVLTLLILLLSGASGMPARAQDDARVLYAESALGGGSYRYDFTFYNDLSPTAFAGFHLYDVSFYFDPGPEITVTAIPGRWSSISPPLAPDALTFFAQSPGAPPVGSEIVPGALLGGFSIEVNERFNDRTFVALFVNPNDINTPREYVGVARSASAAVPEPSALLLVLTGVVAGVGGIWRWRRS